MSKWKGRIIGVMTLGGSAIGLAAILQESPNWTTYGISMFIFMAFAIVFVYGIVAGVLIIERTERATALALPFWLAQIPVIQSPLITYGLFTGAKFDILIQSGLDIGLTWSAGSSFSFYLLSGNPFAIGVNVVAIGVCYLILKNSPEPAPP